MSIYVDLTIQLALLEAKWHRRDRALEAPILTYPEAYGIIKPLSYIWEDDHSDEKSNCMALAHDNARMKIEEFFQFVENNPERRYEFLDGTISMMTGGTARHALIGSNLNRLLGNLLEGSRCLVYSSDAYVQISETVCVCPDLTVSCDPRDRDDLEDEGELKVIQYPRVVVEVLSPGTEAKDRGIKSEYYQSCSTMQEFLLVDTQAPKIQLYRRTAGNLWTVQIFRLHEEIELKSIGVTFPVASVYANTRLVKQP